jgi:hypothetical protein
MKKMLSFLLVIITAVSCEEILLEPDISDEVILLVAPSNNAQFNSTGITFTWEYADDVTQYHIQIAKPDFNNPLQIIADNTTDVNTFTAQLTPGNYEWRVQGVNTGYETAYSTRAFTVVSNDDFENNFVTLLSPSNNTVTNSVTHNLAWESVLGATGYQLQITDASGATIIDQQDLMQTSLNYTFTEGSFQWRIRATNGEQYTLFASRNMLVDITSPNTPVLSAPANLYNSSDNDVIFQWSRAAIAGSVETDSIYIYNNSALTSLEYKNQQTSPYNTTLDDGTYYWFVKSFDEAGNVSQQSSTFSFTLN